MDDGVLSRVKQEKVWQVVRIMKVFNLDSVRITGGGEVLLPEYCTKNYIKLLVRCFYVIELDTTTFKLIKNTGPIAPSVELDIKDKRYKYIYDGNTKQNIYPVPKGYTTGDLKDKIWREVRKAQEFSVESIGNKLSSLRVKYILNYIRFLYRAGYVVSSDNYGFYKLIINNGILHPMNKKGEIYDPNNNEVYPYIYKTPNEDNLLFNYRTRLLEEAIGINGEFISDDIPAILNVSKITAKPYIGKLFKQGLTLDTGKKKNRKTIYKYIGDKNSQEVGTAVATLPKGGGKVPKESINKHKGE